MTANDLPPILTAQHIADFLMISRQRVYELMQLHKAHGGIPNFQIGATRRVDRDEFLAWIEKRKAATP